MIMILNEKNLDQYLVEELPISHPGGFIREKADSCCSTSSGVRASILGIEVVCKLIIRTSSRKQCLTKHKVENTN